MVRVLWPNGQRLSYATRKGNNNPMPCANPKASWSLAPARCQATWIQVASATFQFFCLLNHFALRLNTVKKCALLAVHEAKRKNGISSPLCSSREAVASTPEQ
jgi:hypothetical protein